MSEALSKNAERIVQNSLSALQTPDQLLELDEIVRSEIGDLSLSLRGEHRDYVFTRTLAEIVHVYIRSLAEARLAKQGT